MHELFKILTGNDFFIKKPKDKKNVRHFSFLTNIPECFYFILVKKGKFLDIFYLIHPCENFPTSKVSEATGIFKKKKRLKP